MTGNMPRGALPSPRHRLAAAMPYEVALIAAPPTFIVIPNQLSFWGNNVDGDCVTAEEAFAKACHQPEVFITEETAVGWATTHGYLNGAVISDVLDKMIADGFQQDGHRYGDGHAQSVDWTNEATLASAISTGPVKIGIAADQLDAPYQAHPANGWLATGFVADPAEDHCVSLCGYGSLSWLAQQLGVTVPAGIDGTQPGYALFTWDTVGIIDRLSMLAITHEAWVRHPTTVVN